MLVFIAAAMCVAAAGEVVENDIVRRRMSMLHGCDCSATAGAGEDDANAGCANMKVEVET